MTRSVPNNWFDPHNIAGGWRFQCSTTLRELVSTNRAATYFRKLMELLEHDRHLFDFHLKIRHNYKSNNLEIIVLFGSTDRVSNPFPDPDCISCHPTHELPRASLLSEQEHTRAWLDGRGRSKLILTPIRHVERFSELKDENGEMAAFWQDAIDLINREAGDSNPSDSTMILNHGTYRKHAHLHLKINFSEKIWSERIAPRYCAKIEEICRLHRQWMIGEECFNNQHRRDSREYQGCPGKLHHRSHSKDRKYHHNSGSNEYDDQYRRCSREYQGRSGKCHYRSYSMDRQYRHSNHSDGRGYEHKSGSREYQGHRSKRHHRSRSMDRKYRHSSHSDDRDYEHKSGSREHQGHGGKRQHDKGRHDSGSRDREDYHHRK